MKKTILFTIISLINICGYAKTFRVGDFEYETSKKSLYTNGVKLKKDYSNKQEVTIPETVYYAGQKYTVGSIDNNAFKDNKNIQQITVPGSVYFMDSFSFKGLKNLKMIKVQPATQELDDLIKDNLKKVKKLPSFIEDLVIGFSTFANCESLETIDLSERKTLIAIPKNLYGTKAWGMSYPFENCKSLKTVISGGIEFSTYNLKAFKGCHQLETLITGTTNPSKYEKLLEKDCPFMTQVFPKISGMSDEQYLTYLNDNSQSYSIKEDQKQSSQINQEIKPIEVTMQGQQFRLTEDIMTIPMQRKDLNGNICALLKVMVPKKGLTFEGNVIGPVEHKNNNAYWVYLSPGTQKIKINIPGEKTKELDLNNYEGLNSFESKRVYEYSFDTSPTQEMTLRFSPKEATILIDGKLYDNGVGEVHVDLPLGEHSYIVAAKGYVTTEGIVKLTSNGPANIIVNLSQTND